MGADGDNMPDLDPAQDEQDRIDSEAYLDDPGDDDDDPSIDEETQKTTEKICLLPRLTMKYVYKRHENRLYRVMDERLLYKDQLKVKVDEARTKGLKKMMVPVEPTKISQKEGSEVMEIRPLKSRVPNTASAASMDSNDIPSPVREADGIHGRAEKERDVDALAVGSDDIGAWGTGIASGKRLTLRGEQRKVVSNTNPSQMGRKPLSEDPLDRSLREHMQWVDANEESALRSQAIEHYIRPMLDEADGSGLRDIDDNNQKTAPHPPDRDEGWSSNSAEIGSTTLREYESEIILNEQGEDISLTKHQTARIVSQLRGEG